MEKLFILGLLVFTIGTVMQFASHSIDFKKGLESHLTRK